MSKINLQSGILTVENRRSREKKTDMLRSIGKQSGPMRDSCALIAKFHYTDLTRPDPRGPARTFLRPESPRNSVGSVRVSDKDRAGPCGSARVRSGP